MDPGYWYGRRPDWNANYWTNNRDGLPTPKNTRDDRGYTVGGPIHPRSPKQKLFFFWSQEFQSRFSPPNIRYATVPTALERQGDFSQSVDSSGNPFPYIRDSTTGLPCSAGRYERVLPGRRRARPDPGEPRLLARPEHAQALPAGDRQLTGAGRTSRARSPTRRRVART